jgi:hypothetical protein
MVPSGIYPALGVTRIVIGLGLMVSPVGLARGLGIDEPTAKRVGWLARIAGARELAIGLGTLRAWHRKEPLAGWVAAQAISDGTDAVAFAVTAARGDVGPVRGWGLSLFAASGAISEGVLAAHLISTDESGEPASPLSSAARDSRQDSLG